MASSQECIFEHPAHFLTDDLLLWPLKKIFFAPECMCCYSGIPIADRSNALAFAIYRAHKCLLFLIECVWFNLSFFTSDSLWWRQLVECWFIHLRPIRPTCCYNVRLKHWIPCCCKIQDLIKSRTVCWLDAHYKKNNLVSRLTVALRLYDAPWKYTKDKKNYNNEFAKCASCTNVWITNPTYRKQMICISMQIRQHAWKCKVSVVYIFSFALHHIIICWLRFYGTAFPSWSFFH